MEKNILNEKLKKYTKIGILGLGITGESTYNFFTKNGIKSVIWDDNLEKCKKFKTRFPEAEIRKYNDDWLDCSHIVVSPGIGLKYPNKHDILVLAEQNNIEIITDNEILYELVSDHAKIIAVTGTNGKSTTTSLIGHILKEYGVDVAVGGNIGIPALDLPLDKKVYVLELSSYQIENLKNFKANYAVLLNITPDHLERYGSMEDYIGTKRKIFQNQDKSDFAIIGIDNPITSWIYEEMLDHSSSHPIGISGSDECKNIKNIISCENSIITDNYSREELYIGDNIYLQGRHNRENFCAAYAVCRAYGIDSAHIKIYIENFVGLSHRMEYLGKIFNVSFYNDSKATNADATKPALSALKNIYWLLGGISKSGGISSLKNSLSEVKKAYLFGRASEEFAEFLNGKCDYEVFRDLETAFNKASMEAMEDSEQVSILLSPACSSLDQFKNFEERGEFFINLYKNLKIKVDADKR